MNYTVNPDDLCLRYVVPFRYKGTFKDAFDNTNKAKYGERLIWERYSAEKSESDIYGYIRNEFIFENEDFESNMMKTGCEWKHINEFNQNYVAEFIYLPDGIPDKTTQIPTGRKLYISDAGLVLFRNNIGFVWYELVLGHGKNENIDSDYLKMFQYNIKEINRADIQLLEISATKPLNGYVDGGVQGHEKYKSPTTISHWVNRQIEYLDGVSYFAQRKSSYPNAVTKAMVRLSNVPNEKVESKHGLKGCYAPDKPILFTYAVFTNSESDTMRDRHELAFHLTNGYKGSYHFSEDISADMKKPFDDVIWYATSEGTSYLSFPSDDNKAFFASGMKQKVRNDYFTLFIKVLYQSYSLLIYAERIQSEVSANFDKNMIDANITRLYEEVNLFLTKSMATSVSFIHHQSEFYIYLNKRLKILEDVESVNSGLNSLEIIQREQERQLIEDREKLKDEQDKENDNKLQAIMGLFALLGIGSALTDWYAFIEQISEGEFCKLSPITQSFEVIAIILISVVSILAVKFTFKALKKAFCN